jgi:hypothetical protein
VRTLILAAVTPDNTPHGYNLTFAFPMLLFAISAVVLYLLFSRPHRRIPAQPVRFSTARSRAVTGAGSATAGTGTVAGATATTAVPDAPDAPASEAPAADAPAADAPAADAPAAETEASSEGTEDTE